MKSAAEVLQRSVFRWSLGYIYVRFHCGPTILRFGAPVVQSCNRNLHLEGMCHVPIRLLHTETSQNFIH